MKKHTSVGSALNSIPRNATQHDITSTWGKQSKGSKPCDLGQIIRCLSTTGSDKYHHPHGRTFTHRELAVMQGFPHEHTFKGHCPSVITRQIGNAVPSSSAKILFGHIRAQMKRNDEAEQRQARAQMMD
jgi:site-specific DNA-cytosine methylase